MKLIAGLGNPGEKYEKTRHNVGFMVVEELLQMQKAKFKMQNDNEKVKNKWLKSKSGLLEYAWMKRGGVEIELIKPLTYMNRSGDVMKYAIKKHSGLSVSDLYVIHDDLDIKLGEYKVQFGVGPKVHNGVSSVEKALGTKEFWRVRVGIENRIQNSEDRIQRMRGERYVLSNFLAEEREVVDRVIEELAEKLVEKINKRY